jgi:hypothetical protein
VGAGAGVGVGLGVGTHTHTHDIQDKSKDDQKAERAERRKVLGESLLRCSLLLLHYLFHLLSLDPKPKTQTRNPEPFLAVLAMAFCV